MTVACVSEFVGTATRDIATPTEGVLSDAELADVMTAAVRLYAARVEARDAFPPPLDATRVTATDVVIAVSEMVRVADINTFDLSMWMSRPRGGR